MRQIYLTCLTIVKTHLLASNTEPEEECASEHLIIQICPNNLLPQRTHGYKNTPIDFVKNPWIPKKVTLHVDIIVEKQWIFYDKN